MNKLRLLFFILLSILTVPLTSCDDDDDDQPSRRQLLTSSQWTAFAVYQNGQDVTPLLSIAGVNVSSIKITFNDNGTYTLDFAGDQDSGAWEFTNNEQAIILNRGMQDELTADINRLDNQELFLEGEFSTNSGTTLEGEFRFRH